MYLSIKHLFWCKICIGNKVYKKKNSYKKTKLYISEHNRKCENFLPALFPTD